MPKQYEDYTTDERGDQHHPAFGIARVGRVHSNPGAVLFQSDLRHAEYIEITVSEAVRARNDLLHDHVRAGKVLVQFDMSLAQFASLVSSAGTEGVPVTIGWAGGDRPGLTMESRLALTASEVQAAAHRAYEKIKAAEAAYEEAVDGKAPAAVRKQLLSELHWAIENAAPNVEYAAKQLERHAEDVVEKSRADVEAMVASAQGRQAAVEAAAPAPGITDGAE